MPAIDRRPRRRWQLRAGFTGAALLALTPVVRAEPAPSACPEWAEATQTKTEAIAARLVALVNARRAGLRRSPLSVDTRIDRVAHDHAAAMAASRRLSHRSTAGRSAGDRLRAASIDWDVVVENLALSSTVRASSERRRDREAVFCHDVNSLAAEIESGWYESKSHRRNMTLPELTSVGTGAAYDPKTGIVYVAQVYVRRP